MSAKFLNFISNSPLYHSKGGKTRRESGVRRMSEEKSVTVKVGCDNTEMLKSLDEVEKKLDVLNEKANQLKVTLSECDISAD